MKNNFAMPGAASGLHHGQTASIFAKEVDLRWRLVLAVLLAAVLGIVVFSWDVMSGGVSAATFPRGDQAQMFAGAFYYYQDAWRFPLLDVVIPGFPQRINIAYTDSIPLLAVLFKIGFKAGGGVVNFTALWLWICVLGQAVGMVLLLEQLRCRRLPETLAGVVMVVVMPAFLFRYWMWHLALCGHFVLLMGFAMYFRHDARDSFRKTLACWVLLLVATLMIHPYLLAMQVGIFLAFLCRKTWAHGVNARSTGQLLLLAGAAMLPLLLWMYLLGYIGQQGVTRPASGFGEYAMNMLAPFGAMGKSGLLPGSGHFARGPGQGIEGFNYLGLGVLFGLLLSLMLVVKREGQALRAQLFDHKSLLLLALLLIAFSVSNRVYLGSHGILSYEVSNRLFTNISGTFRSSGRFFWPVGYLLVAGMVVAISRSFQPRVAAAIFLVISVIQWMDTSELRRVIIDEKPANEVLVDPLWQRLVREHRAIALYPPNGCSDDDATMASNTSLQMLAAQANLPTNSVSSARLAVDCRGQQPALSQGALTVLNPPYGSSFIQEKGWGPYCQPHQGRFFCSAPAGAP